MRFSSEPFQGTLIIFEERPKLVKTTLVVILEVASEYVFPEDMLKKTDFQPLLLFLGKHAFLDHPCLDGYTSQALKTEPDITIELATSLSAR